MNPLTTSLPTPLAFFFRQPDSAAALGKFPNGNIRKCSGGGKLQWLVERRAAIPASASARKRVVPPISRSEVMTAVETKEPPLRTRINFYFPSSSGRGTGSSWTTILILWPSGTSQGFHSADRSQKDTRREDKGQFCRRRDRERERDCRCGAMSPRDHPPAILGMRESSSLACKMSSSSWPWPISSSICPRRKRSGARKGRGPGQDVEEIKRREGRSVAPARG